MTLYLATKILGLRKNGDIFIDYGETISVTDILDAERHAMPVPGLFIKED